MLKNLFEAQKSLHVHPKNNWFGIYSNNWRSNRAVESLTKQLSKVTGKIIAAEEKSKTANKKLQGTGAESLQQIEGSRTTACRIWTLTIEGQEGQPRERVRFCNWNQVIEDANVCVQEARAMMEEAYQVKVAQYQSKPWWWNARCFKDIMSHNNKSPWWTMVQSKKEKSGLCLLNQSKILSLRIKYVYTHGSTVMWFGHSRQPRLPRPLNQESPSDRNQDWYE